MNNIVEFIERQKNESRKKMLHFSSYSIYDLISFVYFTIISFTSISPFLTSMNGFPFFLTYSCVSTCGRKERTEIFAYLGFNVHSLGCSIVSYTCKCLNQTVTREGTSIP